MSWKDDETYLKMALEFSKLSKCVSRKVGCLLVKDRRVVGCGYNGTPSGYDNCCQRFDSSCFDREEHHRFSERFEIHAEMNALLFAARKGISVEGATLFTSLQPCMQCVKNIVQAGIVRVVYSDDYDLSSWDVSTALFLKESQVELVQHPLEPNR